MNAKEMWDIFAAQCGISDTEYEAWAFGDDPDRLAQLALCGQKTGTSSAYAVYEHEGEHLPKEGEYSVILDSHEEAVCIIRTTKVYIVPFCEVSAEHARKEGEGDLSLSYWRQVHEDFFRGELEDIGLSFSENMKVVCEEFEVVYRHET